MPINFTNTGRGTIQQVSAIDGDNATQTTTMAASLQLSTPTTSAALKASLDAELASPAPSAAGILDTLTSFAAKHGSDFIKIAAALSSLLK